MEEENKNVEENVQPVETPVEISSVETPAEPVVEEVAPVESTPAEAEPKAEEVKEEPKEESPVQKKKSNKPLLIVILVIFMAFIFGLGFYLGKQLYEGKNCKCKCECEPCNNEPTPEPVPEPVPEPTPTDNTFDLANFDPTKKIDGSSNIAYGSNVSEVSSRFVLKTEPPLEIIGTKISDDKKTVTVTVNWDGLKEVYPTLNGKTTSSYSISFDKNVRAVYVNGWGQGWGQETIFYLMEDGTVEYTPVTTKVVEGLAGSVESFSLKSYGAIPGVEGVVILAMGDEFPTNSEYGGGMAILGIKSTGDFYDLSAKLGGTDPYKYY